MPIDIFDNRIVEFDTEALPLASTRNPEAMTTTLTAGDHFVTISDEFASNPVSVQRLLKEMRLKEMKSTRINADLSTRVLEDLNEMINHRFLVLEELHPDLPYMDPTLSTLEEMAAEVMSQYDIPHSDIERFGLKPGQIFTSNVTNLNTTSGVSVYGPTSSITSG